MFAVSYRIWDAEYKTHRPVESFTWQNGYIVNLTYKFKDGGVFQEDPSIFIIEPSISVPGIETKANGKEAARFLYVGDIIRYYRINANDYKVFKITSLKAFRLEQELNTMEDITIIGNIHENPEIVPGIYRNKEDIKF